MYWDSTYICACGSFAPVSIILPLDMMAERNIWLIASHSSHHWIIEEIILQVLILFQDNSLTALTDGIQSYWDNIYSRRSFNRMWILQKLDLLDNFNYRSISEMLSVQTYNCSTLYKPFIVGMHTSMIVFRLWQQSNCCLEKE
jgi:hypothetical protein